MLTEAIRVKGSTILDFSGTDLSPAELQPDFKQTFGFRPDFVTHIDITDGDKLYNTWYLVYNLQNPVLRVTMYDAEDHEI